ncbi:MAG: C40 family peptidase, partial [Polyangiaceae bacterium]|nr:C40 family peptidase [Polyangiaceae bacterium]
PYGWGDRGGARDCSRYLLDVFASFGLEMPRHSGRQAAAGTFSIDASAVEDPAEKRLLIQAAAKSGIVLLHFPGHIMVYLGENEDGVPMAIHAFSEYLVPCDEGGETLRRVDRVEVSDLSLGAGSSRRSFLERITKIVVLGRPAHPEARGAAMFRPPAPPALPQGAACRDSADAWIVTSPIHPTPGKPFRVIVASTHDPAPATLAMYAPDGTRVAAEVHELGGPPYGHVATWTAPAEGTYSAVLGDGTRVVACEQISVRAARAGAAGAHTPGTAAWSTRWRWERDTENLYALFVENLFRSPDGEMQTWENLGVVIRDPSRNLLYDHLGLGEDDHLRLTPDCADLPYLLRAYFAWKLRLPFAFRRCSRGRAGVAPTCGAEPTTNMEPVLAADEIGAFREFARMVSNAVHSASARTLPTT